MFSFCFKFCQSLSLSFLFDIVVIWFSQLCFLVIAFAIHVPNFPFSDRLLVISLACFDLPCNILCLSRSIFIVPFFFALIPTYSVIDSINYDMLSYQSSLLISFQTPPLFVSILQHIGFYRSFNDPSLVFFWKAYFF